MLEGFPYRKKALKYLIGIIIIVLGIEAGLHIRNAVVNMAGYIDTRRYIPDPYLIYRPNPGYHGPCSTFEHVEFNSIGLNSGPIDKVKSHNQVRIAALGNSITFGFHAVQQEYGFTMQLESMLNRDKTGKDYLVLNCGVSAYSSFQGVQFTKHYLGKLQPDIMLVGFGWTEAWHDYVPDKHSDKLAKKLTQFNLASGGLLNFSLIYAQITRIQKRVRDLLLPVKPNIDRKDIPLRVSLSDYRENLKFFVDWCRENNVVLIFWIEPEAKNCPQLLRQLSYHKDYMQVMREAAQEYNVHLIEMDEAFAGYDPFKVFDEPITDPGHPTPLGHKLMAETFYKYLKQWGYLEPEAFTENR
ncbi:SGNH/GDSL hydrolase family protein [bacterium]|nr:SGNH/GDSL hydrolase family protein [bacterium]